MQCPFPGMDPYLEHLSLWPDVHNRLIAAMADALVPKVAPRYYVALEQRTYLLATDEVSPGWRRPQSQLHAFSLPDPMPAVLIPLLPGEEAPLLPLNHVFHELYTRARFDLRFDYMQPSAPPLHADAETWARPLIDAALNAA
ncbi:MAG: DUF4058 family protein [Caldilineaceae bacterium]